MQAHLRSWIDVVHTNASQVPPRKGDEVQICLHIMDMFHMLPASSFKLFESLLGLTIKGEKALATEVRVVRVVIPVKAILRDLRAHTCTCTCTYMYMCILVVYLIFLLS